MTDSTIAVLDIDGTLIDSNYQHALAWYRALRSVGQIYPVWRLHRLIGMGGDQVVTALGGEDLEHRVGDQAREQFDMTDPVQRARAGRSIIEVLSRTPSDKVAVIAIDDGNRGASAQRDLSKPFSQGRLGVARIEGAESDAWNKSIVPGAFRAIDGRRHHLFSGE